MNRFERLVDRAADHLEAELQDTDLASEADEIVNLVEDLNFPGLLAVASVPSGTPTTKPDFDALATKIAKAVSDEGGGSSRLDTRQIRTLLADTLTRQSPPDDFPGGSELRNRVIQEAVERLASEAGVPIEPDQVREAVGLLTTREFFGDVSDATAAILFMVRSLPLAIARDTTRPRQIFRVATAVLRDLAGGSRDAGLVFADLTDGQLDDPPVILGHTLEALYGSATLRSTAETLQELIKPENRSVRLAVVIYARANGIPITDADLDTLRTTALNPDSPDLGPAVAAGISRLAEQYKVPEMKRVLARLSAAN